MDSRTPNGSVNYPHVLLGGAVFKKHRFFLVIIRDVAKFPVLLSLKFSSFSSAGVPYSSLIFLEVLLTGVS